MTVNGSAPSPGRTCQKLYLIQYLENWEICDPVNQAIFCFDDAWYRLYFEPGMVFWRESLQPEMPVNSILGYGLLLSDFSEILGAEKQVLAGVTVDWEDCGSICVVLSFDSGMDLNFRYSAVNDSTAIKMHKKI